MRSRTAAVDGTRIRREEPLHAGQRRDPRLMRHLIVASLPKAWTPGNFTFLARPAAGSAPQEGDQGHASKTRHRPRFPRRLKDLQSARHSQNEANKAENDQQADEEDDADSAADESQHPILHGQFR